MNNGITDFIKNGTKSDSFDGIGEFIEKAKERKDKERESNAELKKRLKAIKLEKNDGEDVLFSYGNIVFDLQRRTLEIGNKRGINKIRGIDKVIISQPNLKNKTPTTIMLLYCIIMEANNSNFKIKNKFDDYKIYVDKYRYLLHIRRKNIPDSSSLDDYVSSLNKLLKISNSEYEITHKKSDNPRIFKKANKSS